MSRGNSKCNSQFECLNYWDDDVDKERDGIRIRFVRCRFSGLVTQPLPRRGVGGGGWRVKGVHRHTHVPLMTTRCVVAGIEPTQSKPNPTQLSSQATPPSRLTVWQPLWTTTSSLSIPIISCLKGCDNILLMWVTSKVFVSKYFRSSEWDIDCCRF